MATTKMQLPPWAEEWLITREFASIEQLAQSVGCRVRLDQLNTADLERAMVEMAFASSFNVPYSEIVAHRDEIQEALRFAFEDLDNGGDGKFPWVRQH